MLQSYTLSVYEGNPSHFLQTFFFILFSLMYKLAFLYYFTDKAISLSMAYKAHSLSKEKSDFEQNEKLLN